MSMMSFVRKAVGAGADVPAAVVIERLAKMKQAADAAEQLEAALAKTDDALFLAAADKRAQTEGVAGMNAITKASVLDAIRKTHNGVVVFAKQELASDGEPLLSEHEATREVTRHFQIYNRGNPAQAFAKGIAHSAEGPMLLRWIQSCRDAGFAKAAYAEQTAAPLFEAKPRQVGGLNATSVNDATAALDQLNELAAEVKAKHPHLTVAQAFARVYTDRANADLVAAERAENRPFSGADMRSHVTPPRATPAGSSPARI